MTNDEIIKQLESLLAHCKSMIEKDDSPSIWEKDCEALEAAIAALRPSGEPLTPEQLKGMDGQPIWIVGIAQKWLSPCWAIVDRDNCLVRTARNWSPVFFENYGKTWLAYAYPPIDRGKWTAKWIKHDGYTECSGCEYWYDSPEYEDDGDRPVFCPSCGGAMTPEAWAELEKRLRE